jgi:hypothetical protein
MAADNALYHALGLLAPDQDFAALQLQLLSSQVIGYYDDATQTMVVVADAGLTPETTVVYVHEYVHALQDAVFGLDSLNLDAAGDDDGAFARVSLREGDGPRPWCCGPMTTSPRRTSSASARRRCPTRPVCRPDGPPAGFPYLDGTDFTSQLYQRGGFAGRRGGQTRRCPPSRSSTSRRTS